MKKNIFYSITFTFLSFTLQAQQSYNFAALFQSKKLHLINREIISTDKAQNSIKLNEKPGEGLVWLEGLDFSKGTIEVDLKGKDELQKSFVGIAFHGSNDSTYEAVYFRPFNFHAKDSVRSIHAVQYISHPEHTWKNLRDTKNGIFEKAVTPKPDPNNWFHAKIIVSVSHVKVFVNNSKEPSLVVERISKKQDGSLGLWLGDGSDGEFKNLVINKVQ